jgi:tRNA (guanine-N7-)-methyltransferase
MSRGRRISRIKLIPPSPEAASKYLLEWDNRTLYHSPENYPRLTGENLFSNPSPMVLEMGCGTGEFLIELAGKHPEQCFIGVEISRRAIYHAVNLAEKSCLENIKFIKADIRLLYPLMQADTWDMIHLNYPDPNYSASRRKHRIFSPEFLDACYKSLTGTGKISIVTDQGPFLLDMLEIAEADRRFAKTHPERYMKNLTTTGKTRFQRAWERVNRPVFHFELQKSAPK